MSKPGVDTETMLIVTTHVTQAPNDKQEMKPALTNLKQLPQGLGTVTDLLADNGYFSEDNVILCEENKVTSYIAVNRENHHPPLMERFQEPPPLPDDAIRCGHHEASAQKQNQVKPSMQ